jgi:hypothetical protein
VGDIDFKVISAAENSNKFQKTRFWKEKSVEDMVTLGPTAHYKSNWEFGSGIGYKIYIFNFDFNSGFEITRVSVWFLLTWIKIDG